MYTLKIYKRRYKQITRQALYEKRNIEARSCNHCGSGRVLSITQSKCVFVALDIQHAMDMHHIVICGLSGSTVFLNITPEKARFKKKKITEHKM